MSVYLGNQHSKDIDFVAIVMRSEILKWVDIAIGM